jgi:hypothetical protein
MKMRKKSGLMEKKIKEIREKAEEWETKGHGCWPSLTP